MASSRRKQDEKHLKILRELVSKPINRTCFDCHQKGPTYINMTIGSFVCTSCSGILRGLNPPHRVKSISMASFTAEEVEQIKSKGNQYCQAVWLGLYDGQSSLFPDTKDEHKIRDFMISKYEKKRFYVEPSVALKNGGSSQPKSESSSSASTPGSDSRSLGLTNAGNIAAVSRPASNIQNAGSSPSLNGLNAVAAPPLKSSSSVDLLSSLGGSSQKTSSAEDPFTSSSTTQSNQGFANFDNANIFSSASISKAPPTPNPPLPPFSFNPMTPLSSSKPISTSIPSNVGLSTNPKASEDRYAALKDLDEAFKVQSDQPPAPAAAPLFGSPSSGSAPPPPAPNALFGTSPVNSGGGFFPASPPSSTQAWGASFPSVNPFSGGGGNAPWPNGANNKFACPAQMQQQANPFAGGADPNFNGQFISGFGAPPASNPNNNGNINNSNGNWSSFGAPSPAQNGASKLSTNPWGPTSPPNPFNAAPVVPTNGTSYNPFL